jgi:hypothetical protein
MDYHDSILARQIAGIDGIITAHSQQNSPVKDTIMNIVVMRIEMWEFAMLVWVL